MVVCVVSTMRLLRKLGCVYSLCRAGLSASARDVRVRGEELGWLFDPNLLRDGGHRVTEPEGPHLRTRTRPGRRSRFRFLRPRETAVGCAGYETSGSCAFAPAAGASALPQTQRSSRLVAARPSGVFSDGHAALTARSEVERRACADFTDSVTRLHARRSGDTEPARLCHDRMAGG